MDIPESIKITSVKPSGTISLLARATPGCHYPIFNKYIRRVRIDKNDPLINVYRNSGLRIVEDLVVKSNMIVEFPMETDGKVGTFQDQLHLAMLMQTYWADNQVSVTLSFDPSIDTDYLISLILQYKYVFKAISFLPQIKNGAYLQMPIEEMI